MLVRRRLSWVVLLVAVAPALPALAEPFDWSTLRPGHWYEVPDSRASAVGAPETVFSAWSGGAYDSKRDRLIVWGGGHNDSDDNAVYVFDVDAHVWSRATQPSVDTGGVESSGEYPDGTPRSRHTYNYILYVPSIDRFCSMGATAQYPSGLQVNQSSKVHCLDFDDAGSPTQGWTHYSTLPGEGATGGRTGYDPTTGRVWFHGSMAVEITSNKLYEWDPVANEWFTRTIQEGDQNYYSGTAAVSPDHQLWVEVGGGRQRYYDLTRSGLLDRQELGSSGPQTIVNGSSPGFVYDTAADVFVGWDGGTSVYTLDPETFAWRECQADPGNTVTPTPPTQHGTFGRFRYIPSKNAFVLVNSANQNVYLYRLGDNCGAVPPDATPPSTPQSLVATPLDQDSIRLTWSASSDPESGVSTYKVYRDGVDIGQTVETSYNDDGLNESTSYTYEVTAVNGAGGESPRSEPASATTEADTTPPAIVDVVSSGDPTLVLVTYSEPVEEASATAVGNYSVDRGITVNSAVLADDLLTVSLSTSEHAEGLTYTLSVSNVRDRASAPNTIAPGTTAAYEFFADLVISDVTAQSGRTYLVQEGLNNGSVAYIDRGMTYDDVPPELVGSKFIQTANDDKPSSGDSFLSFDVNQPVTVWVAHDDRYATKPSWLAAFTDSGSDLTIGPVFSLYRKDYPQQTIVLGGNVDPAETADNSMYTVIVVPRDAPVVNPPTSPPNLRIKR